MWFDLGLFDVGINDMPFLHSVNIYDRVLQIVSLDLMLSLPESFILAMFAVYCLMLIKEFIKGCHQ